MGRLLEGVGRRAPSVMLAAVVTIGTAFSHAAIPPELSDPDVTQAPPLGPAFHGLVPGDGGVSAAGNATYRLPIALPPGINGLAPDLSLSYNSNVKNGVFGAGWFLSGDSISRITRCPSTLSQNGRIAAVELSQADRFCLDGQQLRAVAGPYGGDATEYRTEADRFARVESHGNAGDGPAWWSVRTRDGREFRYGASQDSRAEAGDRTVVRQWALDEVLDQAGNHYQLYYDENTEEGIQLLTRVAFTGNQYTGKSPDAEMLLEYEERSDDPLHYLGGVRVRPHPRRVSALVILHQGQLLHRYQLTYEEVGVASQSRLLRIVRCDGESHCQEPVEFDWWDDGQPRHVVSEEPMPYTGLAGDIYGTEARRYTLTYGTSPRWHDLNADGALDYVHVVPSSSGRYSDNLSLEVRMSGPEGYTEDTWPSQLWAAPNTYVWADLDGDGGTDIASPDYRTTPDSLLVARWTGSGFDTTRWDLTDRKGTRLYRDVDGDRLLDLLVIHRHRVGQDYRYELWVSLNNRSGFEPEQLWFSTPHRDIQVIDLTGDGLVDIITEDRYVHPGNGAGFDAARDYGSTGYYKTSSYSDFNGDGLADRHTRNPDGSCCRVEYNTGVGFEYAGNSEVFPLQDIDGNGFLDAYNRFIDFGDTYVRFDLAKSGEPGDSERTQFRFGGQNEFFFQAADINGDGVGDFALARYHMCRVWSTGSGTYAYPCEAQNHHVGLSENRPISLLKQIRQGLGRELGFDFRPLTDSAIYTRGTDSLLPVQDVQDATWVVSRMTRQDPGGSAIHTDYRYRGLKRDLGGRGLLGFESIEARPSNKNLYTKTFYSQAFPAASQPVTIELRRTDNNRLVRASHHQYQTRSTAGGAVFAFSAETINEHYDLDSGDLLVEETTLREVDDFGNLLEEKKVVRDIRLDRVFGSRIENSWQIDTGRSWRPGKLMLAKSYRWLGSEFSEGPPRVIARAYDDATGLLRQEQIQPGGSSDETVTIDLVRDLYGNVVERRVSAESTETRTEETVWDDSGRFPLQQVNPLGHVTSWEWDGALGLRTSETDPNGQMTVWSYDRFGRPVTETRPDGGLVRYAYWQDNRREPVESRYHLDIETVGEGPRRVHFDFLGREVREQHRGFHGNPIAVDTHYDSRGRIEGRSEPYDPENESAAWNTTAFDELDRPIAVTAADPSRSTTMLYDGFDVERTSSSGFTRREQRDALGHLITTIDEAGSMSVMEYDAWGNRVKVTTGALTGAQSQVEYEYDLLGRLRGMRDPNHGYYRYWYDALGLKTGEETPSMRAAGQQISYEYDPLGRMTRRQEPEGETRWDYDHSGGGDLGLGKLHRVEQPGYTMEKRYEPQAFGKLTDETVNIGGSAVYHSAFRYDDLGRLRERILPGGHSISRRYNASGYLERLSIAGESFYQLLAMDSSGRVTREWQGDGSLTERSYERHSGRITEILTTSPSGIVQDMAYGYDESGNMSWREDRLYNLREEFSYDPLSRLRSASVSNGSAVTFDFDPSGRLLLKSDSFGNYDYGPTPFHGVATTSLGAVQRRFGYDANGNTASVDDTQVISWSSYNKPTQISTPDKSYVFDYGPDRLRYTKTEGGRVTHYVGDSFERINEGPSQKTRLLLRAYGRLVMIHSSHSGGSEQIHLHSDHQGSVTAVTRPTDGAVLERFSYDAWGKRRNPLDWQSPAAPALYTNRGYTGHEHLDDVGLIHMNGRIYNPALARMLSPDPVTQAPDNGQNYDRYGYAFNNPLKNIDPSGFISISIGWNTSDGTISISELAWMIWRQPVEFIEPIREQVVIAPINVHYPSSITLGVDSGYGNSVIGSLPGDIENPGATDLQQDIVVGDVMNSSDAIEPAGAVVQDLDVLVGPGISGQIFIVFFGVSASSAIASSPTSTTACVVTEACFQIGVGFFGGVSTFVGGTVANGAATSGEGSSIGVFVSGGIVSSGGGSVNIASDESSVSGGKSGAGPGIGGTTGLQFCKTRLRCTEAM